MEIKPSPNNSDLWNIERDGVHIAQIWKMKRPQTFKFLWFFTITIPKDEYDVCWTMNKNLHPPHAIGFRSYEEAKHYLMKCKLQGF